MSWVATSNDFLRKHGPVNGQGPTSMVHKYFYDGYDKHVLITSNASTTEDEDYQRLAVFLRLTYKHVIEEVALNIRGEDLINPSVIGKAVNALLLRKYKNDEIDIFISPGTPAMQVAWYLACMSLGLNIRLFQTVSSEKSKSGISEQRWITPDQIGYMSALMFRENHFSEPINPADKVIPNILKPIYERASRIALADVSVLITGETGTGKELLARHIHQQSHRRDKRFIAVNCAAFGNDLLESRLFGHKKGAFTGALTETQGFFSDANEGTIFLDEIGDISPYMQQTLLRVLGEGEIIKVGGTKSEKINVRVIAATNKDIYNDSVTNQFRSDLYYRLSTCEFRLPSVQEYSMEEKDIVFSYLWQKAKVDLKRKEALKLPAKIKKTLLEYHYPGNIREMENIVYGIWAEAEGLVNINHLPKKMFQPNSKGSLKLKDIIRNHTRYVYDMFGQNVAKTANVLGVQPNTVRSKLSN